MKRQLTKLLELYAPPRGAPLGILIGVFVVLAVADHGTGYLLQASTVFSVTQLFATLGPVALGLGLVMMAGEYDLSVAGVFAMAGAIAVLTGENYPLVGVVCAIAAGISAGIIQGCMVVWLRIPAISITLGGLLVLLGLTYVLAQGTTIPYRRRDATQWLQETVLGGTISNRGAIVFAVYVLAALVLAYTQFGRDLIAVGSNRSGARAAGVNSSAVLVGTFAAAGALSALGGALLSYSLAAASAVGLSDVLVPATAAAIIGGVSLSGGKGRPIGIAAGVLTFCLLRSGLSSMGVHPFMLDTVTGCMLLLVAVLDAPRFAEKARLFRRKFTAE